MRQEIEQYREAKIEIDPTQKWYFSQEYTDKFLRIASYRLRSLSDEEFTGIFAQKQIFWLAFICCTECCTEDFIEALRHASIMYRTKDKFYELREKLTEFMQKSNNYLDFTSFCKNEFADADYFVREILNPRYFDFMEGRIRFNALPSERLKP